jgi:polyhydroxyalkanoate synthesis regulator phasin
MAIDNNAIIAGFQNTIIKIGGHLQVLPDIMTGISEIKDLLNQLIQNSKDQLPCSTNNNHADQNSKSYIDSMIDKMTHTGQVYAQNQELKNHNHELQEKIKLLEQEIEKLKK